MPKGADGPTKLDDIVGIDRKKGTSSSTPGEVQDVKEDEGEDASGEQGDDEFGVEKKKLAAGDEPIEIDKNRLRYDPYLVKKMGRKTGPRPGH